MSLENAIYNLAEAVNGFTAAYGQVNKQLAMLGLESEEIPATEIETDPEPETEQEAEEPEVEEEAEPKTYTKPQVKAAIQQFAANKGREEAFEVLGEFDAEGLSSLDKKNYAAFMEALESRE